MSNCSVWKRGTSARSNFWSSSSAKRTWHNWVVKSLIDKMIIHLLLWQAFRTFVQTVHQAFQPRCLETLKKSDERQFWQSWATLRMPSWPSLAHTGSSPWNVAQFRTGIAPGTFKCNLNYDSNYFCILYFWNPPFPFPFFPKKLKICPNWPPPPSMGDWDTQVRIMIFCILSYSKHLIFSRNFVFPLLM